MRIVIFHYHLNPGGVTSVIAAQIKALLNEPKCDEIILLTGYCDVQIRKEFEHVNIVVDKALYYRSDSVFDYDKEILVVKSLFRQYCSKADVLHAHNPNLGKNPIVIIAISQLAKEGYHIINHAHDFAEDRPANLQLLQRVIEQDLGLVLRNVLYPSVANYHFVVLNTSDKKRLSTYNIGESRIHLLPNTANVPESTQFVNPAIDRAQICTELGLDTTKLIVSYPVRVIQRKNIGEFILLACIFHNKANWVVTQPPRNPAEIILYERWKDFCRNENITIFWEAGTKTSFSKLVSVSDFCISTSYLEGFGLAFLEPWLYHTPVIGRNIPLVTSDLKDCGLTFTRLYEQLLVENKAEMHQLAMPEQMEIIRKCLTNMPFREKLMQENVFLTDLLNPIDNSLIEKNIEVILKEYSLEKYGRRLHEIYRTLVE